MSARVTVGMRIHYTGDMSNASGEGVVTSVVPCDWYGQKIKVVLDDGRVCAGLTPTSFGPMNPGSCSPRFQIRPEEPSPAELRIKDESEVM